jgi:hypothetical protein
MSATGQSILCAPPGLLPAEQLEYWRSLAHELYALAKQYASECAECGGSGSVQRLEAETADPDDDSYDWVDCSDCADIRAVIEKAEGHAC